MRIIFALVLLLGLGLAGFAVYMAQGYIAQIQVERDQLVAAQGTMPQLTEVVVAKRPLKYGDRMTRDDVQTIKWPADSLPAGIFHFVERPADASAEARALFDIGETRPRAALRSFEPFEPILGSKVTDPGIDAGINANLTPGMRAFTIRVDASSGVSGFLRPGDRVDVYWTGRIGDRTATKLIQSAIRLIAINQNSDVDRIAEAEIAQTVTAEVSPEQVAALTQAQSSGTLNLSLVGTGDIAEVGPIEIDQKTLLGIQEDEFVPEAVKEVCTIRTNKGGEIVVTEVECPN